MPNQKTLFLRMNNMKGHIPTKHLAQMQFYAVHFNDVDLSEIEDLVKENFEFDIDWRNQIFYFIKFI